MMDLKLYGLALSKYNTSKGLKETKSWKEIVGHGVTLFILFIGILLKGGKCMMLKVLCVIL